MATKSVKKAPAKRTTKSTSAVKKTAAKKHSARATSSRVDYYPNRMTVAVSALAGTVLVLLAVITVLGSRS